MGRGENMNFIKAAKLMNTGKKVRRKYWMDNSCLLAERYHPELNIFVIKLHNLITKRTSKRELLSFLTIDMITANDWKEV